MSSSRGQTSPSGGPVVRCGHLRKLKTLKKKYFVLRGDSPGHAACLEYYDSKKKFDNRQPPKRSISMRSCFNINRRVDTKHMHVIALYTKDECFSLILDNERELEEWLNAMLILSGDVPDGEQPRPTFAHVWQVTMQKKGLGERKNIHGPYRLCLTDRTLSLVKVGAKDNSDSIDFSLICIRRCGYMEKIFYMEVGRSAVTGGGDFWMEAEDNTIAHNMHAAILSAMSSSSSSGNAGNTNSSNNLNNSAIGSGTGSRDDVGPRQRGRSSSANEASKPISVLQRRHTGAKLHGFSPLEEQTSSKEHVDPLREQNVTASAPSQCSQSQSTSSSNIVTAVAGTGILGTCTGSGGSSGGVAVASTTNGPNGTAPKRRRHSVASHPHSAKNSQSAYPTTMTMTTATSTTTTTTAAESPTSSATKSHQRTLSLPLSAAVVNQSQSSKRSVLRCATGRDRCDSLPSRARTASEGHPTPLILGHPRGDHLAPHVPRPHSMYGRGLSYSPPVTSMPISPASGACSTDSAGSSLSMDDAADNILEEGTTSSRYGHSLTPDEPVILEENLDDYAPWSGASQHKYSPNFKSHSPLQQNSYVEMYSPCGSSPGRGGNMNSAYMPMSPATGTLQQQHHQQMQLQLLQQQQQHHQQQQQQQPHSHSRASSLIEEATLPDGYVPMAPVGDDGYVDMDPSNSSNHNGHFPDDMSQHGGSSCSVTSGTPSTDLRFSEYHLEKVTSYLAPGEEVTARPTRAYSVGSRPEPTNRHRKNRLDIAQQESSRVRAFSVGSRSKRPEIVGRLANMIASRLPGANTDCSSSNKSNSAPLLSSSWGHNSGCSANSERMEDLMELDFTKPNVVQETMNSPPSLSYSHSQSYSTATDTSSYVDMSPGLPHSSSANITATVTAPYVDMSGINKINRNNIHNSSTGNSNNNINNNNNNNSINVSSSSGSNNIHNNNNNNNNNTTTANHNHYQPTTSVSSIGHKPVIKTLKPVEEAEGAYMRMESSIDDWSHPGTSPKQAASPMQDDYMQMNGPPGMTRTAPVDLPQPRRPIEGYVEMSFKSRPSLEQDYMNMSIGSAGSTTSSGTGSSGRNRSRRTPRSGGRSSDGGVGGGGVEKSVRSKPIAIQMPSKGAKVPSFLPLNGSPTSESLASTPASPPPRATPTGSNATIFPFSLNSPLSPIKPFGTSGPSGREENDKNYGSTTTATTATTTATTTITATPVSADYAMIAPGAPSTSTLRTETSRGLSNAGKPTQEAPESPLTKRLAELTLTRTKISKNTGNNSATLPATKTEIINEKALLDPPEAASISGFRSYQHNHQQQNSDSNQSPLSKRRGPEMPSFSKMKSSRGHFPSKDEPTTSAATKTCELPGGCTAVVGVPTSSTPIVPVQNISQPEMPTSPLTKRLCDLNVAKAKLVQSSPTTSPTPTAGFKIIQSQKSANNGKIPIDEGSGGTTPTTTPTPTPSPLDSEGYEKLQPGATILHYASLDLPEIVGPPPPVSPTPVLEAFNYAEIDFAKLKQN